MEPLMVAMKKEKLKLTTAQIYILPISTEKECFKIASKLRQEGLNVAVDLSGKSMSKNLDYANKLEIPYCMIVGEDELKKKVVKLKNMKTGKEFNLSLEKAIEKIKAVKKQ
jgi:histidyl-tRNA synthetase